MYQNSQFKKPKFKNYYKHAAHGSSRHGSIRHGSSNHWRNSHWNSSQLGSSSQGGEAMEPAMGKAVAGVAETETIAP
jgi:hypothetical protein